MNARSHRTWKAPAIARTIAWCAVATCAALAGCGGPHDGIPPNAAEMSALRSAIDHSNAEWIAAFADSDADRLAGLFDEEGAMLKQGGRIVRGRAAIRTEMAGSMRRMGPTRVEIKTDDVWALHGYAYETGKYVYSFTPAESGPQRSAGRYLTIWRRGGDGTWRIARDVALPE